MSVSQKKSFREKIKKTKLMIFYQEWKSYYSHVVAAHFSFQNRVIQNKYSKASGFHLNVRTPKTFDEKINWIKMFSNNKTMTVCADKYAVREYICKKGFAKLLNPIYGVYTTSAAIAFETLPKSFVLKCNHGNSQIIIVRDKQALCEKDKQKNKKQIQKWLNKNFYYINFEKQYKQIKPKILCEAVISDGLFETVTDYKIHCFNGVAHYVEIQFKPIDRYYFKYYDLNWNEIDCVKASYSSKFCFQKPICFDQMINFAKNISAEFDYVRVDLYVQNNKPVFGELTFTPFAGNSFVAINDQMQAVFGEKLVLTSKSGFVLERRVTQKV